jgi:AcrR family transcriptional regulator
MRGEEDLAEARDKSSATKLLDAAIMIWAARGHAGMSARGLATLAGLPTSSIYHFFGDLERLYFTAQAHAQRLAAQWCDNQIAILSDLGELEPQAFGGWFATLVDDWSRDQRGLAFTWREAQLMATHDARFQPMAAGWQAVWAAFWESACSRCGLHGLGLATRHVFDSESLYHLIPWRRPVDRAALDEFARGWTDWLCGSLAEEGPWRRFARDEAARMMPALPPATPAHGRIAAAAAQVLAQAGASGLTHRAVAARAGVTLGVVSYHFRTSSDLFRAAFEAMYTAMLQGHRPQAGTPADAPPPSEDAASESATVVARTLEELVLAIARDPELIAFGPQLRYFRGRSSGPALQEILGPDARVSPLDAALYSSLLAGQYRSHILCGDTSAETGQSASTTVIEKLRQAGGNA